MRITVEAKHLNGLVVVRPEVFEDERGFFMEVYRDDQFQELGLPTNFVQDNHSRSSKGVLRGLHFQWEPPMGKLMRVTYGSAFLAAVDIRQESPTLGQWFATEVSAQNKKQVWAPAGFARGFYVLSDYAEIQYKCTGTYNSKGEGAIRWNDPDLAIQWPLLSAPTLSDKDMKAPSLKEWLRTPQAQNFPYDR